MKTIQDLIPEYIEHLRSLRYSAETVRKAKENLRLFSSWLVQTCQVQTPAELSSVHLKKWHRHLSALCNPKGYPLKAASINRHIITVRGFLKYLARNNSIRSDLAQSLPLLKEPKRLPGSVLSHAQVKKLLARIATGTAEGYRNRTILELLYSTGIRANELLALDVTDININHQTALINGKGDKERMVPVGRTALRYLESYIVAVRPFLLRNKTEKALFPGKDGNRFSYAAFRRMIAAVTSRAGLDKTITAHTFRRSCATELIRSGANMSTSRNCSVMNRSTR